MGQPDVRRKQSGKAGIPNAPIEGINPVSNRKTGQDLVSRPTANVRWSILVYFATKSPAFTGLMRRGALVGIIGPVLP